MQLSSEVNANSSEHRHRKVTNLTVIGISVLFILATVLLFWNNTEHREAQAAAPASWTALPRNTTAKSLCVQTDHNKACLDILKPVPTAPVGLYIQMTINATIQEMKRVLEKGKGHKNQISGNDNMSLGDCLEMIELALDSLKQACRLSGLYTVMRPELKTLLSAAISYQVTCLDGAKNTKIRVIMFHDLKGPMNQISNALAMVDSNVGNGRTTKSGREKGTDLAWFSTAEHRQVEISERQVVVSPGGTEKGLGEYSTINEALRARGDLHKGRFIIHVKTGTYHEYVTIDKHMVDVVIYGDGPKLTVITGNRTTESFTMYQTATFAVIGKGFICKSITIENNGNATSRGVEGVALRVQSDTAAFQNCRIHGYKASLHALAFRQFFTGCVISGNRDFLHGDSAMVIQNSTILVRRLMAKPQMITIISQSRLESHESTGFVIQNCTFKLDGHREGDSKPDIYLGRPRKPYSRTVVMESDLGDLIEPKGWTVGSDTLQQTVMCIEYDNRGLASDTSRRVEWKGFMSVSNKADVQNYTVPNFVQGGQWIEGEGITFQPGLSS